jgi:hypothetical protein
VTIHETCPLCGSRKAKRDCPALGRRICAVCCATKRLTEIACPDSCAYLTTARAHPAATVQRRQERDLRFFLPLVSDLTEPQVRILMVFRAALLSHAKHAIPAVLDSDVADAAEAVAATLETARKGVIYEHQPTSIPAQRLATTFREALAAVSAERGARVARVEADAAATLRRMERGARTAQEVLTGDEAPIFIGVLRRLMPESGMGDTEGRSTDAQPGGPLIVPG